MTGTFQFPGTFPYSSFVMHTDTENNIAANSSGSGSQPLISIVLPVYNEFSALKPLATSLLCVFECLPYDCEILFINDGSTDGSDHELDSLTHPGDPSVPEFRTAGSIARRSHGRQR